MQYSTKFALLAAAVFGATAFAAPLAPRNVDYDLEAREVELDAGLTAREFYEMYLEARSNPELDARSVDAMDLEAREYLEYLEARDATTQKPLATPSSPAPSATEHAAPAGSHTPEVPTPEAHKEEASHPKSRVALDQSQPEHGSKPESKEHESKPEDGKDSTKPHSHLHLKPTKEQKEKVADPATRQEALHDKSNPLHHAAVYEHKKEIAKTKLKEDPKLLHAALEDKDNKLHKLAVKTTLSDPAKLKAALASKSNPLHKAAKRLEKHRKVKKFLSDKHHYEKALKDKHSKYHKAAVHKYLSKEKHLKEALHDKHSHYHKAAVKMYLSEPGNLKHALADKESPYHRAAERYMRHKKLHHKHHHKADHKDAESKDAESVKGTQPEKGVETEKASEKVSEKVSEKASDKGAEGSHPPSPAGEASPAGDLPTPTSHPLAEPAAATAASKLSRRWY